MEQSATYVALLEHVKPAWLRAIRPLPPGWLIAPATGEVFKGNEDCHQRLQSMILTLNVANRPRSVGILNARIAL